MARTKTDSTVLTIRLPTKLARRLAREARRRGRTRSEIVRAVLLARFGDIDVADVAAEARRQSLLVSRRRSEREALKLAFDAAHLRGWK